MKPRPTIDVSPLRSYAFGHSDPSWWAMVLLIVIETTTIVLLLVSFLYILQTLPSGPPDRRAVLPLLDATVGSALLLLSALPNHLLIKASEKEQLRPARRWLIAETLLGIAFLVMRGLEFRDVSFKWDAHAYGSAYWTLLGMNAFHVGGGVLENLALIVLLFKGPVEKKLMPDLVLGGYYWYFGVLSWLAIYAVVYGQALLGGRG